MFTLPGDYGFTLTEILVSVVIIALIGITFFPNLRRFNTDQQYQNEVTNLKSDLKKTQSMFTTRTSCSATKSVLSWSLIINQGTPVSYYLKANCINGSVVSTESLDVITLKNTTLLNSTCPSSNTAIELKFNKTGFAYSCDANASPSVFTSANFSLQLQNLNNTSQSATILINTVGTISQN